VPLNPAARTGGWRLSCGLRRLYNGRSRRSGLSGSPYADDCPGTDNKCAKPSARARIHTCFRGYPSTLRQGLDKTMTRAPALVGPVDLLESPRRDGESTGLLSRGLTCSERRILRFSS
jgi:hypothetical protein